MQKLENGVSKLRNMKHTNKWIELVEEASART